MSSFNPALKAALAARTAANSPWPAARPIGYHIEPAARLDGLTAEAKAESEAARDIRDFTAWQAREAEAKAVAKPAGYDNSPAMAPAKSASDLTAFAGRLEAKAVALRLEASEAVRLEALADSQAGWLTAEAEAKTGRAAEAEALEAKAEALRLRAPILKAREAASMESRSAQIAAEAREAVRLDGLAASIREIEKAKPAEFGQAEAEARAAVISDICESEKAKAKPANKYNNSSQAKTAEAGERIKLSAVIPADMRKPEHRQALAVLEFDLTLQFGGYTVSKARGGWLDGSGEIIRDSSQLYSVSFDPAARDSEKAEAKIIGYFVTAGEALGEEWLHIERSIFTACHRKAS